MTECLKRYASHADGSFPLPNKRRKSEPSSVSEAASEQKNSVATQPQQAKAVADIQSATVPANDATSDSKPASPVVTQPTAVFRIQLGAFSGKPDASKLAGLEPITTVYIPERKLTKYFSGAFATYDEAANKLNAARAAGFNGAFIVKTE